jgi:hypothetical protein
MTGQFDDPNYQAQSYVRLFGGEQLLRLEERLVRLRENLERAQSELELKIVDLQRVQQEIHDSKGSADQDPVDEFNRLLEHPNIERVEVTRDTINVFTDTIAIDHRNHLYTIGKFRIELYTGGLARYGLSVKMFNLNGSRGRYEHPHVHAGGDPCLGNIGVVLPNILNQKKYPAAIALCIQYLKTINAEGDYLEIMRRWY